MSRTLNLSIARSRSVALAYAFFCCVFHGLTYSTIELFLNYFFFKLQYTSALDFIHRFGATRQIIYSLDSAGQIQLEFEKENESHHYNKGSGSNNIPSSIPFSRQGDLKLYD